MEHGPCAGRSRSTWRDPLSEAMIQGEIQTPAILEVIVENENLYYRSVNDKLVGASPLTQ